MRKNSVTYRFENYAISQLHNEIIHVNEYIKHILLTLYSNHNKMIKNITDINYNEDDEFDNIYMSILISNLKEVMSELLLDTQEYGLTTNTNYVMTIEDAKNKRVWIRLYDLILRIEVLICNYNGCGAEEIWQISKLYDMDLIQKYIKYE